MRSLWIALALVIAAAHPGLGADTLSELTGGQNVLVFSDRNGAFAGDAEEQVSRLNDEAFSEYEIATVFADTDQIVHFAEGKRGRLEIREIEGDRSLVSSLKLKRSRFSAVLLDRNGDVVERFTKPVTAGDVVTLIAARDQ